MAGVLYNSLDYYDKVDVNVTCVLYMCTQRRVGSCLIQRRGRMPPPWLSEDHPRESTTPGPAYGQR